MSYQWLHTDRVSYGGGWRCPGSTTCCATTTGPSVDMPSAIQAMSHVYEFWKTPDDLQKYLIISWYLHVRNGVAVAAYIRLASWSQAKFHTKKLSPLVRPCAAAPAQSTTSAYRSLDFHRATSSQRGRWVGSWPLLLRSVHEDTS